ncbi:MAG: hypothetical protein AAB658_22900, partial [Chloroflexota bacterium]
SPRSGALIASYDKLYNYLKGFSVVAMKDFTRYQHEVQLKYHVADIKAQNLADLREFLLQSFGDYNDYQLAGKNI